MLLGRHLHLKHGFAADSIQVEGYEIVNLVNSQTHVESLGQLVVFDHSHMCHLCTLLNRYEQITIVGIDAH